MDQTFPIIGLNWRAVQRISQDVQKSEYPIDEKGNRVLPEMETASSPNGKEPLSQNGKTNTEITPQTTNKDDDRERESSPSPAAALNINSQTAVAIWAELIGHKASKAQKDAITHFVESLIYFDTELWRESIRSAVLSGCNPANIEAICNTYWYGNGNYGEWQSIRKSGYDKELLQVITEKPPWGDRPEVTNVHFSWTEGKPQTAEINRIETTHGSVDYTDAADWLQGEAWGCLEDHFVKKGYQINSRSRVENLVSKRLTPRQQQCKNLLLEGWTIEQIADKFNLSPHTVASHLRFVAQAHPELRLSNGLKPDSKLLATR